MKTNHQKARIGLVIPAYRVSNQILSVISEIDSSRFEICVVDDACPEASGKLVQALNNSQITVLFHKENRGVGGAMKTGYRHFLDRDIDIVVKIDGDGQMNVKDIDRLVQPILDGSADYVKGNRYFSLSNMIKIPKVRLIGNIFLTFLSKASSGYWDILDPNNGFIAISMPVLKELELEKISDSYFFESDMLFRLNLIRAKVVDVPIEARYGSEKSSLSIFRSSFEFPVKYLQNLLRRTIFVYLVRDFSVPSFQLIFGSLFSLSGIYLGISNFLHSQDLDRATPPGTLILFALFMFFGFQLIVGFVTFDIQNVPKRSITSDLKVIQNNPSSED